MGGAWEGWLEREEGREVEGVCAWGGREGGAGGRKGAK